MNINWLKRLLIGTGFALVLGSLTAVMTQAQPPQPEIRGDDCQSCHEPIISLWQNSSHSQVEADCLEALSQQEVKSYPKVCDVYETVPTVSENSEFEMTGVSCQMCHPSNPEEHPQKVMYTDTSSRLCGDCHVETFDEMQDSVHNQEGMACVRCHNPHDNGLRAGGVQDTCRSCHRDETHFYTFTDHAAEGMLCTDCHLRMVDNDEGGGHRQHTFTVGTDTCTECHGDEMHFPMAGNQTSPPSDSEPQIVQASFFPSLGDQDAANLDSEPMPGSHINFIILAAIIGMLFGLIGSPWLEKWYRRHDDEEA